MKNYDKRRKPNATPVIFRKFPTDGDMPEVIAFFPTIPGTNQGHTCLNYMHVGQHGAGDVNAMLDMVACRPRDWQALLKELEGQGYDNLRVYTRYQPAFTKTRLDALAGLSEPLAAATKSWPTMTLI